MKVSDLGPTQLKNIAEPIHVYALDVDQSAAAKPARSAVTGAKLRSATAAPRAIGWPLRWPALTAIAVLLFLAAAGSWAMLGGRLTKPAQAAHLSIVVLPFANLSGDPSQDYFSDGITENLTTELARIKDSFVIARNTAFTYEGKSVDAKEIGKELGVRYLLEGSVQRDGTRVRVNAQLVDAESGAQLWADRFDEGVSDLFRLQDEVVARLGNVLGFELVKAEAAKSVRTNNPDAIDLAMRGWATMWRSYPEPPKEKRDSHYAALALFDQALKADPNDADALAGEAFTHMSLFIFGEADTDANLDAENHRSGRSRHRAGSRRHARLRRKELLSGCDQPCR